MGWKSKDLTLVPEGGICIAVPHAVMKSLVILANGDRPSETKPSTATFIYFGGGYRSEEVINMNNEKPDETQPETFQEKKRKGQAKVIALAAYAVSITILLFVVLYGLGL